MITEKDLQEAIAECEGERNPNANTCIKLAAFYTIKEHMFGSKEIEPQRYSFSGGGGVIQFDGDSEFARSIAGMQEEDFLLIMDELMTTLEIVQPRLYAGVMRKIKGPT